MSEPLPQTAEVVVIGGGIIGVSALYHLAKRGVSAVLLERKQLGSGTTWHAAGIVGQLRDSKAQSALTKYTARLFASLEAETGQATGFKQNGTLHVALSSVRMEQLRRSHDHARRMEIESKICRVDELMELWPWLNPSGILGGFFIPSNGQANPLDVTQALAKGARQAGGAIFERLPAIRILSSNGRVRGVETERGVIATEKVLLAGGMWTHRFAKSHGVTVPVQAAEHFYIVTEEIAGLPRTLPCLLVLEERSYWKEEAGKLLIGGFEAEAKAWGEKGIPESFEFDELPFDIDRVGPLLETAFDRMPALAEIGIKTFFCGPESFTPDGRSYLGPAPELPGLWVAAGMNSNGIMLSGGVGLTMAEWIIEGMPKRGITSVITARAHPFQSNNRYLVDRTAEALGLHYGLLWPGRQIETARGVRRMPIHDTLKAHGAVFAERSGGWEVPMYFDKEGRGWPTRASMGHQDWSEIVAAECIAARDAAVLFDQSMYGKIVVQGPDAARALNRVCGADVDVAVGVSAYTQFLNRRGGIEADVTITRLAPQKFLVLTGPSSQIRDQSWIASNADQSWRFELFDATSAYALLTLQGPASRAVLQQISDDDLSAEALPFTAAREIDVAYARAWVIRRSFFGELGFELLVPTEFTAGVYEAMVAAGLPHGLKHAGLFAMNHCRMEKAFRHFGHDIAEEDTPYETGLGFAVDPGKHDDFLGRDVLAAQHAAGAATPDRMVAIGLKTADERSGPFLIHNELVWRGDAMVGHVTSGAWGYRIERSLGIATLHNAAGVSQAWLEEGGFEVQIAGDRHPIDVRLSCFYDPAGKRMRS